MKLLSPHLTRFADLIPIEVMGEPITIVGAGAIGSFTALCLAKMGFGNITVYDFDKIEIENIGVQFYRFSDIGKPKVDALKDLLKDFTGIEIIAKNEKYEKGIFPGVVVAAVDSMAVRDLLWKNHKKNPHQTKLFVDPRMAIEQLMVYAMNPANKKDIVSYEKTLYSDTEAVQERCTNRSIVYTSAQAGAFVAKAIKDKLTNKPYPRITNWNIAMDAMQSHSNIPR